MNGKRIYVDGNLLTEKQTLLLAKEVSKEKNDIKTLSELESYMHDFSLEVHSTEKEKSHLIFIHKEFYAPNYRIDQD